MRYVTNITLDEVIVHILNPRKVDGFVLSERTLPLNQDRLVQYFVDHIQNSLKDSATRAARFQAIGSGITSGICQSLLQEQYLFNWENVPGSDTGKFIEFLKKNYNINWITPDKIHKINNDRVIETSSGNNSLSLIINNEKTQVSLIIDNVSETDKFIVKAENTELKIYQGCLDLVKGSHKLAKRLYDIIDKDGRINPCDLAVCIYHAESHDAILRYLALLSIEQSEGFRHKTTRDSQGLLYVNLEIEKEVMPSTREKLQKCAFVRQHNPSSDYDLMLLDRQKSGKDIAKFFIGEFMGAEPALDAMQRTDILYTGLTNAHNAMRSELQPGESEFLDKAIQFAIRCANINIDTWINNLSLSEKHKKQIDQIISQKLPDREFELDKTYVEKKLIKKRRFQGDYGLRVVVNNETEAKFKKIIKSVDYIDNEPETPPYYRIEIHTEKWDEVL